ncbi:MAG: class I SAM-dependent methyltransferase [Elusimicrobia bacterium]|nr:class I SAM-dependent methyltransferase [Candidatus Liberimonas magnetica]
MIEEIKPSDYLYTESIRKDILPLIREKVDTALEVGCSYGNTLSWLKQEGYCKKAFGIEINENAAKIASQRLDGAYHGNIEKMDVPIAAGSIDLLLCLDVLEHLFDPWAALKKLKDLMSPNGTLIVSIPNVQHFSIVLPLFFKGQWDYSGSGTLDKTHLRFFTGRTLREMITNSGFQIEIIHTPSIRGSRKLLNTLTFKVFQPLLVFQYLLRAKNK